MLGRLRESLADADRVANVWGYRHYMLAMGLRGLVLACMGRLAEGASKIEKSEVARARWLAKRTEVDGVCPHKMSHQSDALVRCSPVRGFST